ncbi:MAG: NAD-dependent epimerase/dehydratase family protein [Actinomycetota bacterium]
MAVSQRTGVTVAVTGASGYIASRVIDSLLDDERVDRVLGFDIAPERKTRSSSKYVFDQIDVRNPHLQARIAGVDVVIHLAFIMDPIRDEAEMRDVNVNGTQNLFRCAGKSGVRKVIYPSSATVYGAHPDNDFPLTEESPLRANLDFSYPAHKLETEYVVREIREEFPDLIVTSFRTAIVFGPNVDNAWSHLLELPTLIGVQGYSPPLQFVHEDDVGDALAFAVFEDLDGPYNLAAEGWLDYHDIVSIVGKKRLALPEPIAFQVSERLWGLGMAEAPAGLLHYVMHPWVMSTEKLAAAGFKCRRSNRETFTAAVERTSTRVRLGRTSVDKGRLRIGALAGAGLLAGLMVWRGTRHADA